MKSGDELLWVGFNISIRAQGLTFSLVYFIQRMVTIECKKAFFSEGACDILLYAPMKLHNDRYLTAVLSWLRYLMTNPPTVSEDEYDTPINKHY